MYRTCKGLKPPFFSSSRAWLTDGVLQIVRISGCVLLPPQSYIFYISSCGMLEQGWTWFKFCSRSKLVAVVGKYQSTVSCSRSWREVEVWKCSRTIEAKTKASDGRAWWAGAEQQLRKSKCTGYKLERIKSTCRCGKCGREKKNVEERKRWRKNRYGQLKKMWSKNRLVKAELWQC